MTFDAPKAASSDEWLGAFISLGLVKGESWTPAGAGVLLIDNPIVWLITARGLLESRGSSPVAAWVPDGNDGALVDLTTGRVGADLDWLTSPEHDLAACLFPVNPAWKIKAFAEARCFPEEELQPLIPVASLSCAYGVDGPKVIPRPLALSGSLAGYDGRTATVTAPLLPRNGGAPLLVPLPAQAGGGVVLAGVCTQTVAIAEPHGSTAPPVRLTRMVPIARGLELIRSEAGKAQRKAALTKR